MSAESIDAESGMAAALAAFVVKVREHGRRSAGRASDAADEWLTWCNRLDALVRDVPALPVFTYLEEDGGMRPVELLAGGPVRQSITMLLSDALGRADAVTTELCRHSAIVEQCTARTLRLLGEPPVDEATTAESERASGEQVSL